MPVETPSIFTQVIKEHLDLKERNARLGDTMPIERYKGEDPFDNHPLFKTEEQARIEETMDGVDPDFSDETLEDVGLGMWPASEQQATATETWTEESSAAASPSDVEDATAENAAPVTEESGFWNTGGARDFDWGD